MEVTITTRGPRVRTAFAAFAVAILPFVAGCSSDGTGQADSPTSVATAVAPVDEVTAEIAAGATLIDVRTPAEFAAGHLAGAVNVDVEAQGFAQQIADLDPEARYVVYCRSGRRAGVAVARMREAGFQHLTNGGGFEELRSKLGSNAAQ